MAYSPGYSIDIRPNGDTVRGAFEKYNAEVVKIYGILNTLDDKDITAAELETLKTGPIAGSRVTGTISGYVDSLSIKRIFRDSAGQDKVVWLGTGCQKISCRKILVRICGVSVRQSRKSRNSRTNSYRARDSSTLGRLTALSRTSGRTNPLRITPKVLTPAT